jgi:hypothetical protein
MELWPAMKGGLGLCVTYQRLRLTLHTGQHVLSTPLWIQDTDKQTSLLTWIFP